MQTKTVADVELALVDRGSGPPLVLLHGFPLDHSMWDAQIDVLSQQHRVIAPDLRGFGRSGVTARTVTMERLADDTAALLDALDVTEPIALAGLSMGGYVAFAFERKYAARLRSLILVDTRAAADTAEAAAARLEMAQRVLREGPAPLVESMMPRLFAPSTVENRPEVVESLRQVMLRTDRQGVAAAARGMAQRPDATGTLAQIECPTLVIVGEQDAISPADEMADICRAIPRGRFVEIPAVGHMSPLEAPAEVNEAMLEFLGSF